jgi:hypothetical protein
MSHTKFHLVVGSGPSLLVPSVNSIKAFSSHMESSTYSGAVCVVLVLFNIPVHILCSSSMPITAFHVDMCHLWWMHKVI